MWDNVVPILLGFVLTTVIGGLFASLLQQRSWRYQNAARLREEERQKASDVANAALARLNPTPRFRAFRHSGALAGS